MRDSDNGKNDALLGEKDAIKADLYGVNMFLKLLNVLNEKLDKHAKMKFEKSFRHAAAKNFCLFVVLVDF